ncbi:DUF1640 domain-containing protein [Pseudomonas gingeri]|uniref:DUF1640 domain-containing protein n=1 Tax=Pseudomonas gingeri TaxID=117681 RepID=A0A7Y7XBW7_9PSED|nr:DUF1640 domain-containing protein [Pseudomonas gingeri]NWB96881.1 DUF1640 domain-containing protein [Pseudomonas gingeri]
MTLAITFYDALTTTHIPPEKAKAVVHAWEAEVENLASKADLKQLETHLTQSINTLGIELRSSIKDLQFALREQGAELRVELKEQRADHRSSIRVLQWSIGVTFLCVAAPLIRNLFGV